VAPPAPVYVYAPPTNGMAIAALILALVFYPLGIVFGHVARRQISRTHEGGSGLATAALIIWIGIAIVMFAFKQQPKPDFARVESATK
jgi:uncharacterized protein HemX